MALIVYQQPQALTPGYNKQLFTALSNQIAVTDFKYIVTIEVNGSGVIFTAPILQRPDGWMVYDTSEWVKNYIEHYFNPNLALTSPIDIATNKTVGVQVKIKEYYTGAIQSTTTINYQAFDAYLEDLEFRAYDFGDYIFDASNAKYFLSKDINTITPDNRIVLGQDVWLHFINNLITPVDNILIELRNGATTIDNVNIAALPVAVNTYDTYAMNINTDMFIGTPASVGNTVRVSFNNGATNLLRWSYMIQEICTKYSDNIIYYLDNDGNVLFFHFEMVSKTNYTSKTNVVKLDPNTLNTVTGIYGSNTWDREDHVVSTAIESTRLLNTNWITESQSTQLKDLWASPQKWLFDGTNLRSVRVTNNGYEEIKSENESLFQYSVTVDFGITETRQRGI